MAVSFVSSATNGATTGTAVSVSKPAGVQVGDVVIVVVHSNGPRDISDNNGSAPFTSILSNREYNGPSAQVDLFYRVIDGTEGSTLDFTLASSDRWSIIASAYRGVDTTTIWDVQPTSTTENTGTGSTNTTDSITTLTDGAMIVAFAVNDSSSLTFTATPGDSFNSRENNSGEQLLALADKVKTTTGSQSAVSWTQSGSNGTWLNNIFALKPAGGDITVNPSVLSTVAQVQSNTPKVNIDSSPVTSTAQVQSSTPTVQKDVAAITLTVQVLTPQILIDSTFSVSVLTALTSLQAPVSQVLVQPSALDITSQLQSLQDRLVTATPAVLSGSVAIPTPELILTKQLSELSAVASIIAPLVSISGDNTVFAPVLTTTATVLEAGKQVTKEIAVILAQASVSDPNKLVTKDVLQTTLNAQLQAPSILIAQDITVSPPVLSAVAIITPTTVTLVGASIGDVVVYDSEIEDVVGSSGSIVGSTVYDDNITSSSLGSNSIADEVVYDEEL